MQLRVVTSTLALSFVVIIIVAFMLMQQMTESLLQSKLSAAVDQTNRMRATVEMQIAATDDASPDQSRLDAARNSLGDRGITDGEQATSAGTFDPILVAPGSAGRDQVVSPVGAQIPTELQDQVEQGRIASQFATVSFRGQVTKALIIGTPTDSRIPNLQLYLVFPLSAEQQTLGIMQNTIFTAGLAIILLSAAIAWIVTRQVVLPVRQAASIAARYSSGHFKERMVVRGEDDMARMGIAFNSMAESLAEQIHSLEEYGDLQKRFTSDVSHELRTPLTTVRMAADIISDDAEDFSPPTKRAVELLESELDRFEALLTDLLEVSRHDAGVAELDASEVDARSAAFDALDTVYHLAEQAKTKVTTSIPDDAVIAQIDPRRVERVLRNLLANAIDHSEGRPVGLYVEYSDDTISYAVRDHGVGLKPGEAQLVFNRFWRADPSRVRRSGGTGLGLAISLEDAKLHRGSLDCWGEPGNGACFRLTIPRYLDQEMGEPPFPLPPRDAVPPKVEVTSAIVPANPVASGGRTDSGAEASAKTRSVAVAEAEWDEFDEGFGEEPDSGFDPELDEDPAADNRATQSTSRGDGPERSRGHTAAAAGKDRDVDKTATDETDTEGRDGQE